MIIRLINKHSVSCPCATPPLGGVDSCCHHADPVWSGDPHNNADRNNTIPCSSRQILWPALHLLFSQNLLEHLTFLTRPPGSGTIAEEDGLNDAQDQEQRAGEERGQVGAGQDAPLLGEPSMWPTEDHG